MKSKRIGYLAIFRAKMQKRDAKSIPFPFLLVCQLKQGAQPEFQQVGDWRVLHTTAHSATAHAAAHTAAHTAAHSAHDISPYFLI